MTNNNLPNDHEISDLLSKIYHFSGIRFIWHKIFSPHPDKIKGWVPPL